MTKKCPFSSEECMGIECALWDDAGPRSGCSFIPRTRRGQPVYVDHMQGSKKRMVDTINYNVIEAYARVHPLIAPWNIAKHFGLVYKKATQDSKFCTAVESGIRRGLEFEYRRSKHHEHIVTRDGAKWKCIECGELFESTRGPVQGI